ncbi:hypothetical protein [Helicobacter aurati]|uniref:hypothetical protein n=1 Tax=Helicobacter aurati TaxID=137778 RepID=UPI0011C079ED|nr:hypothetical protein [Helicobacter aurati]
MVYLFIIVLVAIAYLLLLKNPQYKFPLFHNSRSNNKQNEIPLTPCEKCGIYSATESCFQKKGKYYCQQCKDLS